MENLLAEKTGRNDRDELRILEKYNFLRSKRKKNLLLWSEFDHRAPHYRRLFTSHR